MKYSRPLVLSFVLFLTTLSTIAWATPPVLTPQGTPPADGQPGEPYEFHVMYSQKEGDPPKTITMELETPSGPASTAPSSTSGTDPAAGISYTFTLIPKNTGAYKYHFKAESSTGQSTQYPEGPDGLEFSSSSIAIKVIILLGGLIIALVFVPFVIYTATRAINKRGDPASAARVGLFIGVLASYGLYWYLFAGIYHAMGLILGGLAAVALLVALLSRR